MKPLWRYKAIVSIKEQKTSLTDDADNWLEVVSNKRKANIIKKHQNSLICGHLNDYYWSKMRADVTHFILKCNICHSSKTPVSQPTGQILSQSPTVIQPWNLLSIDSLAHCWEHRQDFSLYVIVFSNVFYCYYFIPWHVRR